MVLASPRSTARPMRHLSLDTPNLADQNRLITKAIQQVQDRLHYYPVNVASVTIDYTMTDQDLLIKADATSGDVTITLLTAAGRAGRRIIIKKMDATSRLVTITPAGSEMLDDSTSLSMTSQYATREYVSDGTNWILVSEIGTATAL